MQHSQTTPVARSACTLEPRTIRECVTSVYSQQVFIVRVFKMTGSTEVCVPVVPNELQLVACSLMVY